MGLPVSDLVFVRIKLIILRAPIVCVVLKSYNASLYLEGKMSWELFKTNNKIISKVEKAVKLIYKKTIKTISPNLSANNTEAVKEIIDFMKSIKVAKKLAGLDSVFNLTSLSDSGDGKEEYLSKSDSILIKEEIKEIKDCLNSLKL